MYLNLMDLWVALDQIAGKLTPLLLEYNPGFLYGLLNRLLLPAKSQKMAQEEPPIEEAGM